MSEESWRRLSNQHRAREAIDRAAAASASAAGIAAAMSAAAAKTPGTGMRSRDRTVDDGVGGGVATLGPGVSRSVAAAVEAGEIAAHSAAAAAEEVTFFSKLSSGAAASAGAYERAMHKAPPRSAGPLGPRMLDSRGSRLLNSR